MKSLYICFGGVDEKYLSRLRAKFRVDINDKAEKLDEAKLCELVAKYDAMLIGASCKMTAKVFKALKEKEFTLATVSVGTDHVDNLFMNSPNVKFIKCVNVNYISVAEHTIMMAMALYRQLVVADRAVFEHEGRGGLNGRVRDVFGETIGVIGAGKIGRKVIEYAKALNMKVLCYTKTEYDDLKDKVSFCSLDYLMKNSNIVSVHVPLNGETEGMIDEGKLSLMRNDAVFINTSRIKISDNKFLAQMMKEKRLFGVHLDIDGCDTEIIDMFKGIDNVILSPHIAGVTAQAWQRMQQETTEGLLG